MSKAQELSCCPFCGGAPDLVDNRMGWFVRCDHCIPFKTVIYGNNVRHLDHQEDADLDSVDWGALKQSAIDAWNRRAPSASSEQQAAQQDAERDMAIGRAVQRACSDLPEGSEVVIHLEKGAGTVYMTDWDGNEYDHFQSDDGFGDVINQAVDGAIAADSAARASNGGKA